MGNRLPVHRTYFLGAQFGECLQDLWYGWNAHVGRYSGMPNAPIRQRLTNPGICCGLAANWPRRSNDRRCSDSFVFLCHDGQIGTRLLILGSLYDGSVECWKSRNVDLYKSTAKSREKAETGVLQKNRGSYCYHTSTESPPNSSYCLFLRNRDEFSCPPNWGPYSSSICI